MSTRFHFSNEDIADILISHLTFASDAPEGHYSVGFYVDEKANVYAVVELVGPLGATVKRPKRTRRRIEPNQPKLTLIRGGKR